MKRFLLTLIIVQVSVLLAGCRNDTPDIIPEKPDENMIDVTLKSSNSIGTRTSVGYEEEEGTVTYATSWDVGDKLGVFTYYEGDTENVNRRFDVASIDYNASETYFTGKLSAVMKTGAPVDIYTYYPYDNTLALANTDPSRLILALPSEQTPSEHTPDPLADIMVGEPMQHTFVTGAASAELSGAVFNRLMAYTLIRFDRQNNRVTDNEIVRQVKLTTPGHTLTGNIAVDLTSGGMHPDGFIGGKEEVSVVYSGTTSNFQALSVANSNKTNGVWFVTKPFSIAEGSTVSIEIITNKSKITKAYTVAADDDFTSRVDKPCTIDMVIDESWAVVSVDGDWWEVTTTSPSGYGSATYPHTDAGAYITNRERGETRPLSWTMTQAQLIQADDTSLIESTAGYNLRNADGIITSGIISGGVAKLRFNYFFKVNDGLSFRAEVYKDNTDGTPVWSQVFSGPKDPAKLHDTEVITINGAETNAIIRFVSLASAGRMGIGNIKWVSASESAELTELETPAGLALSGSPAYNSLTVTWNAVTNASGYKVSVDNGATWSGKISATEYTAEGLNPETTYSVKVAAMGDGVEYKDSPASAAITVTTSEMPDDLATFSVVTSLGSIDSGTYLIVGDSSNNLQFYTFGAIGTIENVSLTAMAHLEITKYHSNGRFIDDVDGTLTARAVTITKVSDPVDGLPTYTIQLADSRYLYAQDGGEDTNGSGLNARNELPDNDAGLWTFSEMKNDVTPYYRILNVESQSTTATHRFLRFYVGQSYFGCFTFNTGLTTLPRRWTYLYKKDAVEEPVGFGEGGQAGGVITEPENPRDL